jgi:hypothetical protein
MYKNFITPWIKKASYKTGTKKKALYSLAEFTYWTFPRVYRHKPIFYDHIMYGQYA